MQIEIVKIVDGAHLGKVDKDYINPDGTIGVIVEMGFVYAFCKPSELLPASEQEIKNYTTSRANRIKMTLDECSIDELLDAVKRKYKQAEK